MRKMVAMFVVLVGLSGCLTGVPGDLQPVSNFELERYSGTWYELYRLDHPFERGLNNVKATYTIKDDGSVEVANSGVRQDGSLSDIRGRAEFIGSPDVGSLKVSFFGPFYSGYHIIALDKEDYSYALVAGATFDYLWILSRTPTLDDATTTELIGQARTAGFDVDALITVRQN